MCQSVCVNLCVNVCARMRARLFVAHALSSVMRLCVIARCAAVKLILEARVRIAVGGIDGCCPRSFHIITGGGIKLCGPYFMYNMFRI